MSRPRPRGKVGGLAREVSRPKPPGGGWGSGWGWVGGSWVSPQAHTQGEVGGLASGVTRPTPGGGLRPTPRGVQVQAQEGVSQHALRQTPPPMATAAGSMHPTGMHSCFFNFPASVNNKNAFIRMRTICCSSRLGGVSVQGGG